jgi:hypothetical protein
MKRPYPTRAVAPRHIGKEKNKKIIIKKIKYNVMGCNMSLKLHFWDCYLNFFHEIM